MSKVLIIDDEQGIRQVLDHLLRGMNHHAEMYASGEEGIVALKKGGYDLIITDLRLPGQSGLDVLAAASEFDPSVQTILITAYATMDNAIAALRLGAYDYVTKPFKVDEMREKIRKALEKRRLLEENVSLTQQNVELRSQLSARFKFGGLVAHSETMNALYQLCAKVAPTKSNVLITGESGTGKEVIAKALHANSARATFPFVPINCGAIAENLIESELFGHVKGAFTGADRDRPGVFEQAHEGTLFLDEIGELPLYLQVKLLRVLQERKVKRVGGNTEVPVDVRVIAATNRELEAEVKKGRFREDLYYRLQVIPVHIPPLRERSEDIAPLAEFFLKKIADESGRALRGFEPDALKLLQRYHYPGNVRQLENFIERAVALESAGRITKESLPPEVLALERPNTMPTLPAVPAAPPGPGSPGPSNLKKVELDTLIANLEKEWISWALEHTEGNKKEAANLLGITYRSFRHREKKYRDPEAGTWAEPAAGDDDE